MTRIPHLLAAALVALAFAAGGCGDGDTDSGASDAPVNTDQADPAGTTPAPSESKRGE